MKAFVSRILWKQVLRPPANASPQPCVYEPYGSCTFRVPRTSALPCADEQIVELPEPRSSRFLTRAGLMLMAVGLSCKDAVAPYLAEDPFSVGLYCAMQDGPDDYKSAWQLSHTPPEDFAKTYKLLRSSRQSLRELGSVQAGFLSIFLGTMGPLYGFTHSRWAGLHALEQAEFDLKNGVVQAAIVGGAFSLEDPLLSLRIRRCIPESSILCEGAAALMLTATGSFTDWRKARTKNSGCFYGTAHQLVSIAIGSEQHKQDFEPSTVAGSEEGDWQCVASERAGS
jgi:hypothetical protein